MCEIDCFDFFGKEGFGQLTAKPSVLVVNVDVSTVAFTLACNGFRLGDVADF